MLPLHYKLISSSVRSGEPKTAPSVPVVRELLVTALGSKRHKPVIFVSAVTMVTKNYQNKSCV